MPVELCGNSVELTCGTATCWLPKDHVGKCHLKMDGEQALREARTKLAAAEKKIADAQEGLTGLLAILELAKAVGMSAEDILAKLTEALTELGKELGT